MDTGAATAGLKRSFLFASVSASDLSDLIKSAKERSFEAGDCIFWEGDQPGDFFILVSGRVKVVKHGSQGRETVVAFFGPGDIFGEVAVLEDKPYPASSIAIEDTQTLSISKATFRIFIERHPAVAMSMVGLLSARLREAQSRLHDLSGERVEQRLARTLQRLATKLGPDLPFTRQDLADMSGTTLETTVRFLRRLKDQNVVSSRRGLVVIKNDAALRRIAESPGQE